MTVHAYRSAVLVCVNLAIRSELSHSFVPPIRGALRPPSTTSLSAGSNRRPSSSNWEDDTKSSRNNPDVTDYKPPWREHEATSSHNNNNNNVGKESFQSKTTDDFKRPHGMPAGGEQRGAPPRRDNTYRHAFQMSSTDDFKRPHDMPAGLEAQQQPPPRGNNAVKAPFQTSSTDDFKRSSDVSSGVGAPQQPIYGKPSRSDTPPWRNHVGQDAFESTQLPKQPPPTQNAAPPQPAPQSIYQNAQNGGIDPPKIFFDAQIINDQEVINDLPSPEAINTNTQPYPEAVPSIGKQITAEADMEQWDKKLETAQTRSRRTLLRAIEWPVASDPLGESSEFPMLMTRVGVTVLSTLATWYLHLFSGCSPVMASSSIALLFSTFVDRRLGQAALCGSLAGMSGGHLAPTLSLAVVLGGLASLCYEVLINVNNLCLGIGGRIGATAFLATSMMAKYRGVSVVGRKLRRGLWKSGAGPSKILVTMILFHMFGSVATIFLRQSSDDSAAADPVRASSIVGLLGSLFLKSPMAIMAVYGGSFVGMSLPSRSIYGKAQVAQPQTAPSLIASFAGAGAIAGLIHAITIHSGYWNGGFGGKAGLCAFAACWMYQGLANASRFAQQRTD